jgi:hypothetical protein
MSKELKRDIVKYIRDKAKSGYEKGCDCYICGGIEELDFHHYCSVSELWNKWSKTNKIKIEDVDDILEVRDRFIEEHYDQMYNRTVTLCHDHHLKLHSIYGRNPVLATAGKQERWVGKQRVKNGLV